MNKLQKLMKTVSGACCLSLAMGLALNVHAVPTITDVTAQQRYPWNGKFDISYTATGVDEECLDRILAPSLMVYAVERTTHVTNVAKAAYLSGDTAMNNGTHKFVWDMDAQGIFKGLVSSNFEVFVSVEVVKEQGGVQLWKDGPYWAECNVGASKPEEYGYYFWWGDTVGYKRSGKKWISVKDGTTFTSFTESKCPTVNKTNAELQSLGYIDATGNLTIAHDAAVAHCCAPWRMPTAAEQKALVDNCSTTWMTTNGVTGRLFVGKGDYASKSIFIPVAGYGYGAGLCDAGTLGYYWSSTPSGTACGWDILINSGVAREYYDARYNGMPVRPLRGIAQ